MLSYMNSQKIVSEGVVIDRRTRHGSSLLLVRSLPLPNLRKVVCEGLCAALETYRLRLTGGKTSATH